MAPDESKHDLLLEEVNADKADSAREVFKTACQPVSILITNGPREDRLS